MVLPASFRHALLLAAMCPPVSGSGLQTPPYPALALWVPNDLQTCTAGKHPKGAFWRPLGKHSARTRHLNAIPRAVIGLINCISTPTCPLSWRYSSDFVDAAPGRPAAQPLGVPAAFDEIG